MGTNAAKQGKRKAIYLMRICYVGDASSYHVAKWVRYFAETGHEVAIISTAPATIHGVTVYHLQNEHIRSGSQVWLEKGAGTRRKSFAASFPARRHLFYIHYFRMTKVILNQFKPDVVHALQVNLYAGLARLTGFRPFILTPFGGDVLVNPARSRFSRVIAKYCISRADMITCDAEHIQPPLIQLGADPRRIHQIQFGVDVEVFLPRGKDKSILDWLGVTDDIIVISMRHHMPIYNIETLLQAAPLVLEQVPRVKFIIASKGPDEEKLKAMARSLGIWDSVRFIGFISGEDLPRFLSSADIYVSTSLSDAGLASSTAEAMASGLPVIITEFGDNAKWVSDGVNGYLFPMKDHKTLADRIIHLALNPNLRTELSQQGRQIVEQNYNWVAEMEKAATHYRQISDLTKGIASGR